MSMILTLKQAPAATLDLLVERPELAVVFWIDPNYVPPEQPGWVKWLARMLGGYTPPAPIPDPPPEMARNGEELSLEKEWHGLQWLLTRPLHKEQGDEWEVPPPEGALLSAGRLIEGSDHGYGDERALSVEETTSFNRFLQTTPWETLNERYDGEAMNAAGVYPTCWTESYAADNLRRTYERLRTYLQQTDELSLGLVVQLS